MSKLGVESSHDDHDDHEGHDHKRRKRETEHSELHAVDTTVRARHSTTLIFYGCRRLENRVLAHTSPLSRMLMLCGRVFVINYLVASCVGYVFCASLLYMYFYSIR